MNNSTHLGQGVNSKLPPKEVPTQNKPLVPHNEYFKAEHYCYYKQRVDELQDKVDRLQRKIAYLSEKMQEGGICLI